jgi:metal-dependent hydrolase (beta-lactamase superfamily II)
MKVTILMENNRNPTYNLYYEHGLSIYLEFENQKYPINPVNPASFFKTLFK